MNLNIILPKVPFATLQTEDPTKDPNFTIILPDTLCVRQKGSRQNTPENRHTTEIDKKIQDTASEITEFVRTSSLDIPKRLKTFNNKLKLSVQSLEFLGIRDDSEISSESRASATPDSEVSNTPESGYNTPQASPNSYENSELLTNGLLNPSNDLKLENFKKPKIRETIGVFIFEGT